MAFTFSDTSIAKGHHKNHTKASRTRSTAIILMTIKIPVEKYSIASRDPHHMQYTTSQNTIIDTCR